jgi:diguanylate cyclase (GGDEF)-like protein
VSDAVALRCLSTILNGMDAAVVAVHVDFPGMLANAAARRLYALPEHGPVSVDHLTRRIQILPAAGPGPLTVDELPLMRALSGVEIESEVLVPLHDWAVGQQGVLRAVPGGRRLLLRARPLLDPDGAVLGSVCTAQDLTDLHTQHALLTRRAAELAAINQATRAVLKEEDARRAVCETALAVSGAAVASLFEPDGHRELVCTTHFGADLLGMRLPQDGPSITADVFATGMARVLHSTGRNVTIDQQLGTDCETTDRVSVLCGVPLRAAVWLPVISRGQSIAVLSLAFGAAVVVRDQLPVLEILAAETAVAIERQDLLRRLRREAASDGLTGAANRRSWDEELPQAIEQAARSRSPLSLVMFDLDHFKRYNDAYGHPAGDALLRMVVSAWRERLRPSALLCRYGGEEFVALLPGCGVAEAARLAEDLRRLVPDGQTCSAGVAGWDGRESPQCLVERVDAALYQAKLAGRNRVHTAD